MFSSVCFLLIALRAEDVLGHEVVEAFAVELRLDGWDALSILPEYDSLRIVLAHFIYVPVLQVVDYAELVHKLTILR